MAKNRVERNNDTRETSTRKKSWAPPEILPVLNEEAGYSMKWVRLSTLGISDPTNISSKLRSGYEAVRLDDHPEAMLSQIEDERFKDNIVIGGLMACKMPTELVEERNAYYNQQSQQQIESVDNNLMRESDPRMPLYQERKSKVTFGSGN
jgi:hypothetical protein